LSGDHVKIRQAIDRMQFEAKALVQAAIEISYFSRGAWSYEAVLDRSALERDLMVDFINKRLEAAGKSNHPVY
jgi:hypothetical protein